MVHVESVTLRDLISEINMGKIIPYENNRGGKLVTKHFKEIAEDLRVEQLGTIILAYNPNFDQFEIVDGHHRINAIKLKSENSGFSTKELNSSVIVKKIPYTEKGTFYRFGHNQLAHTSNQKITNPDTSCGFFLKNILAFAMSKNNERYDGEIKSGQLQVIIDTVVCSWSKNKDFNLYDLILARSTSQKLKLNDMWHEDKPIKIDEDSRRKLINSLALYLEIRKELDDLKKDWVEGTTNYSMLVSAVKSSGFMSALLVDAFSSKPIINRMKVGEIIKVLTKRRNLPAVEVHTKNMGRRNGPTLEQLKPLEAFLKLFSK
jgi:hypothetical protein